MSMQCNQGGCVHYKHESAVRYQPEASIAAYEYTAQFSTLQHVTATRPVLLQKPCSYSVDRAASQRMQSLQRIAAVWHIQ